MPAVSDSTTNPFRWVSTESRSHLTFLSFFILHDLHKHEPMTQSCSLSVQALERAVADTMTNLLELLCLAESMSSHPHTIIGHPNCLILSTVVKLSLDQSAEIWLSKGGRQTRFMSG